MTIMTSAADGISVVVPTYNEVENVEPLCKRLFAALKKDLPNLKTELLLVDDESAGSEETEKIVAKLAKDGYGIRMHRRYRKEGRGLSSAVVLGFKNAKYEILVSMDADLQHEPEAVPAVLLPVLEKRAEFTVGCRYMQGGGLGFDWSLKRQAMSLIATFLAIGLTSSRDPMSGFFCLRKSTLDRAIDQVNPIGFKIGLEIMARCGCKPVEDVPITFQERLHGESKLTMKQNVEYIQQLAVLYWALYKVVIVAVALFLLGLVGYLVQLLV